MITEYGRWKRGYLTSFWVTGFPKKYQQHEADNEQRTQSNNSQWGDSVIILGVLLFSCKQTQEGLQITHV